jgi:DNA-binding CsgD family transcriptional regulator
VADGAVTAASGDTLLVGRNAEAASLGSFLDALADGPRALILRGPPGIGKTILWRNAIERARKAGFRVLVTRPAEEEMPLALVGVLDLLEPVGADTAALQAGDDPFVRGRAVHAELLRLADDAPVVIAIDDLQWLDEASARALRFALRRVTAEPLGVLATVRAASGADDPLTLARLLPPERCEAIELRPLGVGAMRSLLGRHVGSISRPVLRRIHETSGGNPLYALELAHALVDRGESPEAWVRLPLPASLQAAIAERLDAAPPEVGPLVSAVAALGPVQVDELRAVLPSADVAHLLDVAHEHGLLVVEENLTVRFQHPLIGSAVYHRLGPVARRSLHAELSERVSSLDAKARHIALSSDAPDTAAATLLEEAAGRASERGAPELAASFAHRSAFLTPEGEVEPRYRRALAEVRYRAAAGEVARALAAADELIAALPPGPRRAEAFAQRVYLDLQHGDEVLQRALDDAGDDDLLCGELLDLLGWLRGTFRGDLGSGLVCSGQALAIGKRLDDRRLQMLAEASLGVMEALAAARDSGRIARAVALADEVGGPPLGRRPRIMLARKLLWDGKLAEAISAFESMRDEFSREGTEFQRPYRLYDLALAAYAAGELVRAAEHAREGAEAAADAQNADAEAWLLYPLALVQAGLGLHDSAVSAAERLLEWSRERSEPPSAARAHGVLGLLALSEGDVQTGASELGAADALLEEMGIAHPGAHPPLADVIEAVAGCGDVATADAALTRLEASARALAMPWPLAAVERARGHVLLARQDGDGAASAFLEADERFARLGYRLDSARAALGRGRALIRAGRRSAAADVLAEARRRFAEMGAIVWEARAAEELERAAPGRAVGELTATERRVAALVAEGRKNREIAQALFMSVATVEAHLTRIYRKLDLRSRSELARLVADGTVSVAGDED